MATIAMQLAVQLHMLVFLAVLLKSVIAKQAGQAHARQQQHWQICLLDA
jgi:hypothetical protein